MATKGLDEGAVRDYFYKSEEQRITRDNIWLIIYRQMIQKIFNFSIKDNLPK